MHMHEEKTGYFRYIKPVRRQNSDWGGLAYPYMHVITEKFKGAHTLFTLNPWREEGNRRYSQVWRAVGISGRRTPILSAHIKTGKLILDQRDGKWQQIMMRGASSSLSLLHH